MAIDLEKLVPGAGKPSYEELSVSLLDAAIELNRLERGEISSASTVSAVLTNLGLRDHQLASGDDLRQAVDPKTIDIYNRAVSQLTSKLALSINDLAEFIRKYSAYGERVDQRPKGELAEMRSFFLALHRELVEENYNRLEHARG